MFGPVMQLRNNTTSTQTRTNLNRAMQQNCLRFYTGKSIYASSRCSSLMAEYHILRTSRRSDALESHALEYQSSA